MAVENQHHQCVDWFPINNTFTLPFSQPPGDQRNEGHITEQRKSVGHCANRCIVFPGHHPQVVPMETTLLKKRGSADGGGKDGEE